MKRFEKGKNGIFVVSLDFELLWGVHDHETKQSFHEQILGARKAVEEMLKLFEQYQIHATWGIVGMLMAENKEEIKKYSPALKPQYDDLNLSSYHHMEDVGENERSDVYHYAHSLITRICSYSNQEIASHTFSHYYCGEPGQNKETFEADLCAAQKIAKEKFGVELKSLILPRNQFVNEYMETAYNAGFVAVRGNPNSFAYHGKKVLARGMRLLDTYIGVCGRKSYAVESVSDKKPINVKASTFFRKYNVRLAFLEKLKVAHIKREMKRAAQKGEIYHLWWHPHNIGKKTDLCIEQLNDIFKYYMLLQRKYRFTSKNMYEVAEGVLYENCNVV